IELTQPPPLEPVVLVLEVVPLVVVLLVVPVAWLLEVVDPPEPELEIATLPPQAARRARGSKAGTKRVRAIMTPTRRLIPDLTRSVVRGREAHISPGSTRGHARTRLALASLRPESAGTAASEELRARRRQRRRCRARHGPSTRAAVALPSALSC